MMARPSVLIVRTCSGTLKRVARTMPCRPSCDGAFISLLPEQCWPRCSGFWSRKAQGEGVGSKALPPAYHPRARVGDSQHTLQDGALVPSARSQWTVRHPTGVTVPPSQMERGTVQPPLPRHCRRGRDTVNQGPDPRSNGACTVPPRSARGSTQSPARAEPQVSTNPHGSKTRAAPARSACWRWRERCAAHFISLNSLPLPPH